MGGGGCGRVILLLGACLLGGYLPVCATRPSTTSSCGDPEEPKGVPDGGLWIDRLYSVVTCLSHSSSPDLSLYPAFVVVSRVAITARTGGSVCSCRIP